MSVLQAHPDAVHGLFWQDPSCVVTGCDAGSVFMHDTRAGQTGLRWSLQAGGGVCSLAPLSPSSGGLFVAGCVSGWLRLLDPRRPSVAVCEQRVHSDDLRSVSVRAGWLLTGLFVFGLYELL